MKACQFISCVCRKTKRGSALFIMQEISMKSILTEYQRKYPAKSHPLRATCGNRNRRFRHFHFFYNLLYGIINVQSSQLRCKETFIESWRLILYSKESSWYNSSRIKRRCREVGTIESCASILFLEECTWYNERTILSTSLQGNVHWIMTFDSIFKGIVMV